MNYNEDLNLLWTVEIYFTFFKHIFVFVMHGMVKWAFKKILFIRIQQRLRWKLLWQLKCGVFQKGRDRGKDAKEWKKGKESEGRGLRQYSL